MKKAAARLACLFALLACAGAAQAQAPAQPPVDEAAMAQATQKARAGLDGFLKLLAAPPPGTEHYAVKVRISEGRAQEYFWIKDAKQDGNRFIGTVSEAPQMVKRVSLGQPVSFARGDIHDWTYLDTNQRRMMGNYSACVLLKRETAEAQAEFKRIYGLRCD